MSPAHGIDFHVHVTPPEISADWRKYAEKEPYFALLSRSPHNKYAGAGDVIAMLDESGFERAVIFGFGFKDMGLCRLVNDYVIEKARQYPGRLTGFMAVPPRDSEVESEIDRCQRAGLKGVGELYPGGQDFEIDNEADTRAFTGACVERCLPVIVHTNEPVGHGYVGKNDIGLARIERFIAHSRGLTVILAHWGGGLLFYECMPELREQFRNVYYDTAATPFLYSADIYRAALAMGLGDKVLFGSDFPLLPPSRYLPALQTLPDDARDALLSGNARRLLG
jgi:predicted TIM-barrel fold metal-dependent hydrolase